MRKLYTLFCLLPLPLLAQWEVSHTDPDRSWQDIQFIDDQVGFVVGNMLSENHGMLLKTTDGGDTWTETLLPIVTHVQRLCFLNADTGFVIMGGAPIRVLHTNNGGAIWEGHQLDSCFAVMGMDLFDGNTALYLNNEGRLRRMTNGGADYTYITNSLGDWGLVDATDAQTAYIAEGDHFLRTTDTGFNWEPLPSGLANTFLSSAFAFSDTQHGFASTSNGIGPNIFRTNDGAATWQVSGTANAWVLAARGSACLAAAEDASSISWTSDGGDTWVTEPAPSTFAYPQGGELTPDHSAFLIEGSMVYKRASTLIMDAPSAAKEEWSIGPNPAQEHLRIQGPITGPLHVRIIDRLGRVVLRTTSTGDLDVSFLCAGQYTLSIETDGRRSMHRLMKA